MSDFSLPSLNVQRGQANRLKTGVKRSSRSKSAIEPSQLSRRHGKLQKQSQQRPQRPYSEASFSLSTRKSQSLTDNVTLRGRNTMKRFDSGDTDRLVRDYIVRQFKDIRSKFDNVDTQVKEKAKYVDMLYEVCCFLYDENQQLQGFTGEARAALRKAEEENQLLQASVSKLEHSIVKMKENYVLPVSEDLESLERSIISLREDIKQHDIVVEEKERSRFDETLDEMDTHNNYTDCEQVSPQSEAEEDRKRYQKLLNTKFKLLENLIIVLKKRTKRLEGENKKVGFVISQYGSLDNLLDQKKSLEKENAELRKYAIRFDNNVLLNRKALEVEDTLFLRTLIFALQNELEAHRKTLEFYDLTSNPSLKLMVEPPSPTPVPSDINSLETWAKEVWQINYRKMEVEIAEKQAQDPLYRPPSSYDEFSIDRATFRDFRKDTDDLSRLYAKLNRIENENAFLHDQNHRLKEQTEMLGSYKSILSELTEESSSNKKLAIISRLEKEMKSLYAEIDELNASLAKREQTFTLQDEILSQTTTEKIELAQKNAEISKQLLLFEKQMNKFRSDFDAQGKSLQALYHSCLAFASTFIQKNTISDNGTSPKRMVGTMYADFLQTYLNATTAATKIQSLVRGYVTRNNLSRQGIPVNCAKGNTSDQVPLSARNKTSDLKSNQRVTNENSQLAVDLWCHILQVFLFGKHIAKDISDFHYFVQAIKDEIHLNLRSEVQFELSRMRKHMTEYSGRILATIDQFNKRKPLTRSTQTIQQSNPARDTEIQCGVPSCDTKVEVRKKTRH